LISALCVIVCVRRYLKFKRCQVESQEQTLTVGGRERESKS
jgi:hypothetical protein